MHTFNQLAYPSVNEMMFGRALHPVTCGFGSLVIGGGLVYPEVKYTLPTMAVTPETHTEVLQQYETMTQSVLARAVALDVPGLVIEFEHPPQMTDRVEVGVEITALLARMMQDAYQTHGLKSALRATICDIREQGKPPRIRTGEAVEGVLRSFAENAQAGAHMLSIESIGGKEVSDRALLEADVPGLLLALGILAPRDMHFLWREIVAIAHTHHVVPAGDTACGFGNTAMVLADKQYIPNVLAAVVRAMTAVRSLVAYEEGAVGPSKDCAYEDPVIKAITGLPISMEGKAAACAHLSHVGNIAAAVCDLWSNESVQNVKLLSGFAPEVFTEVLAYDCRLMNQAIAVGQEKVLQQLLVDTDEHKSVHALIISPQSSYRLAEAIVQETGDFNRTHRAARTACQIIREAVQSERLRLPKREITWLARIEGQLEAFAYETKVLDYGFTTYQEQFLPQEYGL